MGLIIGIIWIILVFVLASVAKGKGRSYGSFLAIGLFLSPLIGFIILLAMGENKEKIAENNISSGISRKCPFCANEIKKEAIVCQYCGRDLPKEEPIVEQVKEKIINNENVDKYLPQAEIPENNKSFEEMICDDNHWICGRCKTINESNLYKCKKCGW